MFIKSRFIKYTVNLLFVFVGTLAKAQSVGQALQQRLIESNSFLTLQLKIENPEKQRYDTMIAKGLLKLIGQSNDFTGAARYTIDLKDFSLKKTEMNQGFVNKLFYSMDEEEAFKVTKYSRSILIKSEGLAREEVEQILESLITFISVSAEKEHRSNYKSLSSLGSMQDLHSPRTTSGVQRRIYFLVGYLQFLDNEMHDHVLEKIQPYFKVIQEKGFDYIYLPYAQVSDLISAMNSEETLAIYWISHSQSLGQTQQPYVLDADKNIIPAGIFAQSYRRQPLHVAMIACYPEKISNTYGTAKIVEDRQMTTWYTEGANYILRENVIRPVGFGDYLNSLPHIHPSADTQYKLYNKLSLEISGAFPLSNKFYVLLNGRYISTLKYNQTAGFESFSILIPKEYFKEKNQLVIRVESTAEQKLRDSQIYVRNVSLSDEKNGNILFRDISTNKVGKQQGALTLFEKEENQSGAVESLDFTL